MLAEGKVMAMVAVKDIEAAKKFYGGTLGLRQVEENPGGVGYESGGGTLFVYASPENAGTNQATSATWAVPDINATVEELKNKGVIFEHYDIPGATYEDDVAVMGPVMKAAWFKDHDGNILGLSNA